MLFKDLASKCVLTLVFRLPDGKTAVTLIVGIGLLLFFMLYLYVWYKQRQKIKCARNNMTYDQTTKTLTLHQRSSVNAAVISVVSDYDFKTSYEPEKYIYTSATVGGITTGGFHKTGGYNYISGAKKNGGAFLSYITTELVRGEYKNKDNLIICIELSDKTFNDAVRLGIIPVSSTSKCIATYITGGKHTEPLSYDAIRRIRDFICSDG